VDHRDIAEQLLGQVCVSSDGDRVQLALTHAVLALVDRLDEFCFVAVPQLEEG
jgi:hypothetical protein